MGLLVVDTQKALVSRALFAYETFVTTIQELIACARESGVEVVYVVHDDGAGSALTAGADGFAIFEGFRPWPSEPIFVKTANSAFKDTGLRDYLLDRGETELVVVGLQTDKCINATVISGFEYGFHLIVPTQGNSTVDNDYLERGQSWRYFNEFLWPGRFAECVSAGEAAERMRQERVEHI